MPPERDKAVALAATPSMMQACNSTAHHQRLGLQATDVTPGRRRRISWRPAAPKSSGEFSRPIKGSLVLHSRAISSQSHPNQKEREQTAFWHRPPPLFFFGFSFSLVVSLILLAWLALWHLQLHELVVSSISIRLKVAPLASRRARIFSWRAAEIESVVLVVERNGSQSVLQ